MSQDQTLAIPIVVLNTVLVYAALLLEPFNRTMPELDLALIGVEGQIIATSANLVDEHIKAAMAVSHPESSLSATVPILGQDGQRIYPLKVSNQWAGALVS